MRSKFIMTCIIILLLVSIGTDSIAIVINKDTFMFMNKKNNIASYFDKKFEVTNSQEDEDEELKQTITELTKKTTYLLLGKMNMDNESSEDYYKRYNDYLNLRYIPDNIPKDENTFSGYDENSQEFKDEGLSGLVVPGMFLKLNNFDIRYNSYGTIDTCKMDDDSVASSIEINNINMIDPDNPENYCETNLNILYIFKKLNDEFKLLYVKARIDDYDETDLTDDYKSLFDSNKNDDVITDEKLSQISNEYNSKIVSLSSFRNTGICAEASGFFLNDGLIMTTYNYIEKSLMKGQDVAICDNLNNEYELDGIVTINEENDIAILKVKNKTENHINVEENNEIKVGDSVILPNNTKSIIASVDNGIRITTQATEDMQGMPIFNSDGKLIGMINSKNINTVMSNITKLDIIKQYSDKLKEEDFNEIKSVSFDELKEKYYIRYGEEIKTNNIPQKKWDEYSKVEDVDQFIDLDLVKGEFKDGIISLRYKNKVSDYIDTMQLATKYRENLLNRGYKEVSVSDSKVIYQNNKYQIIIMKEFDYLIVIMVKV